MDNFIVIREELLKNNKFKKLDGCLTQLWEPILDLKTPIRKIRNNYIAHIQDEKYIKNSFDLMIQDIIDSHQVPTSWGFWIMLAGLVMLYGGAVRLNLKKEWDVASKKYVSLTPVSTKYGNIGLKNYQEKLRLNLKKTNQILLDNGYASIK